MTTHAVTSQSLKASLWKEPYVDSLAELPVRLSSVDSGEWSREMLLDFMKQCRDRLNDQGIISTPSCARSVEHELASHNSQVEVPSASRAAQEMFVGHPKWSDCQDLPILF